MEIDISKFVNAASELSRQARAEEDHGPGYDTPEKRKEFVEFFEPRIKSVISEFEKLKEKLK